MIKYVIGGLFIAIALVVVLMATGVIPGLKGGGGGGTLTRGQFEVWGVIDDEDIYNNLAAGFSGINPGVKITYKKKAAETYEQELLRAFAAGTGPDAFQIHHTWLAKYQDILAPAPADIFPLVSFKETFVDVVGTDFAPGQAVYGVPLYVDTLALYYNTDLFNSAGIVFPPTDWDGFETYSRMLTKRKQSGDILLSGAAMGSGSNIASSADILALLMLQQGAPLIDQNGRMTFKSVGGLVNQVNASEKALEFYASFAKQGNPNYSWPATGKDNSETVFSQNRAAMMLGYAEARSRLRAKNPKLKFEVAPMPQIKGSAFRRNYADYWGFGVYKNSKNQRAAWEFLKYLTIPQNAEYYLAATGRPAAHKALIQKQQQDQKMKVFADQALSAISWLQRDAAVIRNAFVRMLDAQATSDQTPRQTLSAAEVEINALLRK